MAETIKLMASKLGFMDEIGIIRKACEYERLLKLKMSGANSISDSAKSVVCLDLAADCQGLPFDIDLALKLAAVKKSVYANTKHNIKKVLNMEDVVSVNSLCVQLGCTKASSTANKILDWFKETDIKNSDLGHPQFACMAVYQACRLEKIKISKSKLVPYSHLKPSQWTSLEAEWTKMMNEFIKVAGETKSKGLNKKNQNIARIIDDNLEEKTKNNKSQPKNAEPEFEDYEIWKKRILETAYKELEMENKKNQHNSIHLKDFKMGNSLPAVDRGKGIRLVIN